MKSIKAKKILAVLRRFAVASSPVYTYIYIRPMFHQYAIQEPHIAGSY